MPYLELFFATRRSAEETGTRSRYQAHNKIDTPIPLGKIKNERKKGVSLKISKKFKNFLKKQRPLDARSSPVVSCDSEETDVGSREEEEFGITSRNVERKIAEVEDTRYTLSQLGIVYYTVYKRDC